MGKVAFVFPGQGAQYPGMGEKLAQLSPSAAAVFLAIDAMRPGTAAQCFSGTEEELQETANTQPCLFAVETAAAAALRERGIRADMTAGFSLGELAALTYAGALALPAGFRAVCRRGALMQQAAEENPAQMAAVLRLPHEEVERLCAVFQAVYPVNYNCPGQLTVAGAAEEMPAFMQAVKAHGGRAVPLRVRGGFHAPFMASAAAAFGRELADAPFRAPELPVYADCTGTPYGTEVRALLERQMVSPVRWESIVRGMIAAGADTFIEVGPGRTLCGLIGRIDAQVRVFDTDSPESFDKIAAEVGVC